MNQYKQDYPIVKVNIGCCPPPPPSESAELTQWPPLSIYQYSEEVMREGVIRARIFKLIRSPRIDSKEPVPPECVAWRAVTTTLFLQGS